MISGTQPTGCRARRSHSGRNTTLLVAGIALGILFNPVTGPETRKWVKDMISGGGRRVRRRLPVLERRLRELEAAAFRLPATEIGRRRGRRRNERLHQR